VQAGVPPSEEALVELLHVSFVGVWLLVSLLIQSSPPAMSPLSTPGVCAEA